MELKITRPNGSEYMTVSVSDNMIEFRNFGSNGVTVRFDSKVLDQLVPFLREVNFWNKVKDDKKDLL